VNVTDGQDGAAAAGRKKVKLSERQKARRMIVQALYQWHMAHAPVHEIQAEFLTYYQGKIDRDYFRQAFSAIVGDAGELDEIIRPLLDRELRSLDPIELAVLRLGIYELAHRIDIPYRVVINEGIELAKVFGATDSHKYVNGILDRAARQLRTLELGERG
jgi:N utilization substance protein B